jgi:hypothetical protein
MKMYRVDMIIGPQTIAEMLFSFLQAEHSKNRERFIVYMRQQLQLWGMEKCGLGENGFELACTDDLRAINEHMNKWFPEYKGEVITIHAYGEDDIILEL